MPQDTAFIDRVLAYAQERPHRIAVEAVELASGVVTVHDVTDDYDTYFDRTRWEPAHPDTWGGLLFEGMEETGMGILLGVYDIPRDKNFREAVEFAKRHLHSTSDVQMYAQPQLVDLEQLAGRPR